MKSGLTPAAIALFTGLVVAACGTRGDDRDGDTGGIPADPDPAGAARAKIGIVFDPSRAGPGDSIGQLVVQKAAVTRAMADSSFVGDISFRGEIELTGHTMRHFEADATNAACFEADSASAARLPRWAGDRRRAWFCFSNAPAATRALGPSQEERPARVVIADFTIHRGLSDQVNSARFVRLVGTASINASR